MIHAKKQRVPALIPRSRALRLIAISRFQGVRDRRQDHPGQPARRGSYILWGLTGSSTTDELFIPDELAKLWGKPKDQVKGTLDQIRTVAENLVWQSNLVPGLVSPVRQSSASLVGYPGKVRNPNVKAWDGWLEALYVKAPSDRRAFDDFSGPFPSFGRVPGDAPRCEQCTSLAPLWNAAASRCEVCPSATPVWDSSLSACGSCPPARPFYYASTRSCLEQDPSLGATNLCPGSFWNPVFQACQRCDPSTPRFDPIQGCTACPPMTPLWDGANCLVCPTDTVWSPAQHTCADVACTTPSCHCANGVKDHDETDVDCGGSCGCCQRPPSVPPLFAGTSCPTLVGGGLDWNALDADLTGYGNPALLQFTAKVLPFDAGQCALFVSVELPTPCDTTEDYEIWSIGGAVSFNQIFNFGDWSWTVSYESEGTWNDLGLISSEPAVNISGVVADPLSACNIGRTWNMHGPVGPIGTDFDTFVRAQPVHTRAAPLAGLPSTHQLCYDILKMKAGGNLVVGCSSTTAAGAAYMYIQPSRQVCSPSAP